MYKLVPSAAGAHRTVRTATGPVVGVAAQVALAVAPEVGARQAVVVRVRRLLELERGETVLAQVVVVVILVLVPAARRTKSFEQLVH